MRTLYDGTFYVTMNVQCQDRVYLAILPIQILFSRIYIYSSMLDSDYHLIVDAMFGFRLV